MHVKHRRYTSHTRAHTTLSCAESRCQPSCFGAAELHDNSTESPHLSEVPGARREARLAEVVGRHLPVPRVDGVRQARRRDGEGGRAVDVLADVVRSVAWIVLENALGGPRAGAGGEAAGVPSEGPDLVDGAVGIMLGEGVAPGIGRRAAASGGGCRWGRAACGGWPRCESWGRCRTRG